MLFTINYGKKKILGRAENRIHTEKCMRWMWFSGEEHLKEMEAFSQKYALLKDQLSVRVEEKNSKNISEKDSELKTLQAMLPELQKDLKERKDILEANDKIVKSSIDRLGNEEKTVVELKKQVEVVPREDDMQYLDAYNHLILKYIHEKNS